MGSLLVVFEPALTAEASVDRVSGRSGVVAARLSLEAALALAIVGFGVSVMAWFGLPKAVSPPKTATR